jgi:hypothetical protein
MGRGLGKVQRTVLQWLSQAPERSLSFDTLVDGVAGRQCCPKPGSEPNWRSPKPSVACYSATARAIAGLERRGLVQTRWHRQYVGHGGRGGMTRTKSVTLTVETSADFPWSQRLSCRYCED